MANDNKNNQPPVDNTQNQPPVEENKEVKKSKLSAKVEATVKEIFKNNPKEKVVFVTSDGSVFFEKNKNAAENHARRKNGLHREKALAIYEVSRNDI